MRSDDEIQADLSLILEDSNSDLYLRHASDVKALLARAQRAEAELRVFKPQPMSQRCRDGHHRGEGDWRCHGCRCLCHAAAATVDRLAAELAEARAENERLTRELVIIERTSQRNANAHMAAEAQVRAVEALHREITVTTGVCIATGRPSKSFTKQTCDYCSRTHVGGSEAVTWPCATIRALAAGTPDQPEPGHGIGLDGSCEACEAAANVPTGRESIMQHPKTLTPCFCCGQQLDRDSCNDNPLIPCGGTQFETYGHYGSTFWDDLDGCERLVVLICDDCLSARRERIARQVTRRQVRVSHDADYYTTVGTESLVRGPALFSEVAEPSVDEQQHLYVDVDELDSLSRLDHVHLDARAIARATANETEYRTLTEGPSGREP